VAGSATLNVKVLVDAAQAASGLNATASKFQSFATKATKLFAGAFVVDKVVGGIKNVANAAADLEQAIGGTDKVFGQNAAQVHAWANDTDDAIRLSTKSFESYATGIGAMLRTTGAPMEQVTQQTHDLMQVSADFAATFGREIGDVANAVRAALAGEYDGLQNMGVAISGNIVHLEALKIAHGDNAKSMEDSVKAQATFNVLMQQGSLYAGQAASEATTFTGQMDALKAMLDNTAAAIGGPLLSNFGDLSAKIRELTPMLTTIGTGLAALISWVAGLPTPILATVAAFALLTKLNVATHLMAAGKAIGNFVLDLRTAPSAMGAFSSAFRTMGAALAPGAITLGLALIAAAILKTVSDIQNASSKADTALKPVEDALTAAGGHWTAASRKLQEAALMGTDAYTSLTKAGLNAQTALEVLKGNADLWMQIQSDPWAHGMDPSKVNIFEVDKILEASNALEGNAQLRIANAQATGKQIDASGQYVDAASEEIDAAKAFEDALKAQNQVLSDNQAHFDILASQTGVAVMLDELARAQAEVARGGAALNAMIDQGQGRSRDYERNTLAWSASVKDLGEAFKQTAEDGKLNMDLITNWDIGGIAEQMPELGGALLDVRDNLGEFVQSAFVASGGMTNFEAGLAGANTAMRQSESDIRAMLAPLGLAPEVVDSVVSSLGILDETELREKELKIIAEDFEARKTALYWESITFDPIEQQFVSKVPGTAEILAQLNASLPPPPELPIKTTVQPPTFGSQLMSGLFGSLFGGGATTTPPVTIPTTVGAPTNVPAGAVGAALGGAAATAGMVTVPISANANGANAIMNAFVNEIRSTTVQIKGEAAQANNTIRAVIGGQYSTTVHLMGDSVPVNNTIRAVIGGQYSTTVHINGDNGPAISAIRAITTGYYSATVHINAEASGFYSVWNSLPTNKTITVTVNQVQGSVVAPPAPGGLTAAPAVAADVRAFSTAPTLQGGRASRTTGRAASAAPGSSVTNINIEVGVGDPDAIARAVKKVVLGRDRRTGGVVVGEMRTRVGHS
jgi:hypothetical protein